MPAIDEIGPERDCGGVLRDLAGERDVVEVLVRYRFSPLGCTGRAAPWGEHEIVMHTWIRSFFTVFSYLSASARQSRAQFSCRARAL